MFDQDQKTLFGEGISFFGDAPDALCLFSKILGFHIKLETEFLQ